MTTPEYPDWNKRDAAQVLAELNSRDQAVLQYWSGLEDGRVHSLEETAAQFRIRPERARQIVSKALKRTPGHSRMLKELLRP